MKKIPKYPKKDFLESLLDNPNIFIEWDADMVSYYSESGTPGAYYVIVK